MNFMVSASLVVVGLIHLLPLSGVLGNETLATLYGLRFDEPNIAILMRHRAVFFGLLGSCLVFAAFRPAFRGPAFAAGFISVVSFLWLAWSTGGYNEQVGRVFSGDVVALVCLVIGFAAHRYQIVTRSREAGATAT